MHVCVKCVNSVSSVCQICVKCDSIVPSVCQVFVKYVKGLSIVSTVSSVCQDCHVSVKCVYVFVECVT